MEPLKGFNFSISFEVKHPGLRWGIREVSLKTASAQAPRYSFVVLKPLIASQSLAALYLNSGLSPSVNKASKQPFASPSLAIEITCSIVKYGDLTFLGVCAKVQ